MYISILILILMLMSTDIIMHVLYKSMFHTRCIYPHFVCTMSGVNHFQYSIDVASRESIQKTLRTMRFI